MADIKKLAEELGKLTVLEAAELVKTLEENGAFPPRSGCYCSAAGNRGAPPKRRKKRTEFTVISKSGPSRSNHQSHSHNHQSRSGRSQSPGRNRRSKVLEQVGKKPRRCENPKLKQPARLSN